MLIPPAFFCHGFSIRRFLALNFVPLGSIFIRCIFSKSPTAKDSLNHNFIKWLQDELTFIYILVRSPTEYYYAKIHCITRNRYYIRYILGISWRHPHNLPADYRKHESFHHRSQPLGIVNCMTSGARLANRVVPNNIVRTWEQLNATQDCLSTGEQRTRPGRLQPTTQMSGAVRLLRTQCD